MAETEGRSPWFYVAIGCGGILVILLLAAGAAILLGFKAIKTATQEMADPAARASRARRMLGAESLPEGYYAGPVFSLPLLFDLAILADRMPREDGELAEETERLFVYFKVIRGGRQWRDYVEGQGDPFEMLDGQGFQLHRGESIARQELTVGSQQVAYVSERGSFETDDLKTEEGIVTLLFIRCPGDKKMRVGVWVAPDPDPGRPVAEVDFSGSVADPEAVRAFISQFDTCAA